MRVEMQYTFGTDSWTSVPVAALLEILSRPPIFAIIRIAVRLRALHHKTWRQVQGRLESPVGTEDALPGDLDGSVADAKRLRTLKPTLQPHSPSKTCRQWYCP